MKKKLLAGLVLLFVTMQTCFAINHPVHTSLACLSKIDTAIGGIVSIRGNRTKIDTLEVIGDGYFNRMLRGDLISANSGVFGTTAGFTGSTVVIGDGSTTGNLMMNCKNQYAITFKNGGNTGTTIGADASYPTDLLVLSGITGGNLARIDGSNGTYYALSDGRLKEGVRGTDSALKVLNRIPIRSYTWKASQQREPFGFIAQDLYEVVPTVVRKPKDESKENWQVAKAELVPLLIKAIQEQQAQIEELKRLLMSKLSNK